jgi:hypothetical protein
MPSDHERNGGAPELVRLPDGNAIDRTRIVGVLASPRGRHIDGAVRSARIEVETAYGREAIVTRSYDIPNYQVALSIRDRMLAALGVGPAEEIHKVEDLADQGGLFGNNED